MANIIENVKEVRIRNASNGDYDLKFVTPSSDYRRLEEIALNSYPSDTATGNPIYFDDGADNIPMKELIVNLEPKQSGSGDPSPTNVRPISGYDGVVVKRAGKNLLQNSMSSVTKQGITYTVNSDGSVTVNGTATANTYLSIACNIPLIVAMIGSGAPKVSNVRIDFMTNDGYAYADNYDGASQANGVQLPTNKTLTSVRCRIENGTTVNNVTFYPMVRNASDTDSAFEPYTEQTYSITFPTDVGTVYGGKLNVTTGVLTVDRALDAYDGSSDERWELAGSNARNSFRGYMSRRTNGDATLVTNYIPFSHTSDTASVDDDRMTCRGTYYKSDFFYIFAPLTQIADVSALRTYLSSNPLQVVYNLETPLTYPLTPTEVSTLLGSNTIQSDGIIELTYRADINKIIERLENA